MDLKGRVALVTGGSRGLGATLCLELAERGADVVVHCRVRVDLAQGVCTQIESRGGRAMVVMGDIRRPEEVRRFVGEAAQHMGSLDLLVNNAAVGAFHPAMELTPHQWTATLESCLTGAWLVTREVVPHMVRGGHVVNLSSLGAHRYLPGYAAVGAAKAGLESLTRSLAVELAPRGIRVNGVAAGPLMTGAGQPQELLGWSRDQVDPSLSRQVGTPDLVAPVVAWLCSPQARWVVGQTLVVDGGWSLT